MTYLESLVARIQCHDQWPNFGRPDFLEMLNDIADDGLELDTVHGYLAAALIYHQLTEEMLKLLLEFSEFFIQLSLAPVEMRLPLPRKATFGQLLGALRSSIEFDGKKELIDLAASINTDRIELVHRLAEQRTPDAIRDKAVCMRAKFDDIHRRFSEVQDWFELCFANFHKDIAWDDLLANAK